MLMTSITLTKCRRHSWLNLHIFLPLPHPVPVNGIHRFSSSETGSHWQLFPGQEVPLSTQRYFDSRNIDPKTRSLQLQTNYLCTTCLHTCNGKTWSRPFHIKYALYKWLQYVIMLGKPTPHSKRPKHLEKCNLSEAIVRNAVFHL